MINEIITTNHLIINTLGWTLLHSLWQICAIAAVLAIFLKFSNATTNVKYNIIQFTLLLIPLISALTFLHYYQNPGADYSSEINYSIVTENFALNEIPKTTITDKISLVINKYSSHLVILWLTGIFLLMIRFTGGLLFTHQLRKSGVISVNKNIIEIVNQYKLNCKIKRNIEIFESVLIKIPLTIGYLKPLILLPVGSISGIPPAQIEAIIAHEIAHIKRSDYLYNLIDTIIEIIFFYHPAIWWIMNRLNEERENCCDDIAINLTGDSRIFARALADLNQSFNHHQHTLAMTGKKNQLLERIKRIAGIKENSRKLSYHSYGFVIATILAATIAFNVKASIQMPDNFLKTSLSMSTNSDFQNIIPEYIPQDTLKNKKKKPANVKVKTKTSEAKKNNSELSDDERVRIEQEMDKLQIEMKKLAEEMKDLHEQLGSTDWNNFDFKFDFDMDSLRIIINEDINNSMAVARIEIAEAQKIAVEARASAMKDAKNARAEAFAASKDLREKNSVEMKAKRLKIKAETNELEEELRKDGLVKGEHFNLKIDNTGMYLDGKKQDEKIYKKYRSIIMSDLEESDGELQNNDFSIQITK